MMLVGEVVAACEYIGCDILDFHGEPIKVTKENAEELYGLVVEHIDAKDSRVRIWTFMNED